MTASSAPPSTTLDPSGRHGWPAPDAPSARPDAAGRHQRFVAIALLVVVGLAFADASVVALALPAMYATFDTTLVGISWVLTTYAVAVAGVAMVVALGHRRVRPRTLVAAGVVVFAGASLVAGAAATLPTLLAARCAQGAGAASLLAGAVPILDAIVAGAGRGRRWWAIAGAAGAAIGPALGGTLTELFDWRAIFFFQAPLALLALLVVTSPAAGAVRAPVRSSAGRNPTGERLATVVANAAFALVFAALVAALFLGVLLAIEVWRYRPLRGAALVSALPVGMVLARFGRAASGRARAVGGCALLALGLAGLALVPGDRWTFAAVAFALCGAGFELVHEVLDLAALPEHGSPVRSGAVTVAARHAGLVLGLLLIAPMLSASIGTGVERATLGATRTMLEADLPLSKKLPVTWSLRDAIESAPRGQVPDLAAEFDKAGAKGDNALARSRDRLQHVIANAMTRSFRTAFLLAAMLAAVAAFPALVVGRTVGDPSSTGPARRRRSGHIAMTFGALAGVVLLAVSFAAGAAHLGEVEARNPCTAPPDTYPGRGLDASVQRIGLSALNGAACELHTSRERLVLSLDANSGYRDVTWDDATLQQAMRAGADRAIDDADRRNAIPGFVAKVLHVAADRAPLRWLVRRIDLTP